jgi:uncharacterized membrane protein YeiH
LTTTIRRQMLLDAAGLAIFAAAGTEKALDYKIHLFTASLLGTVTGAGGGTSATFFSLTFRASCNRILTLPLRWAQ